MRNHQFPEETKNQSKQTNKQNTSRESFLQTRMNLLDKPRESSKGLKPTLSWIRAQTGPRFPPFWSTLSWRVKSFLFSPHPFASESSWAGFDRSPVPVQNRTVRYFKHGLPHKKGSTIGLSEGLRVPKSAEESGLLPTSATYVHGTKPLA